MEESLASFTLRGLERPQRKPKIPSVEESWETESMMSEMTPSTYYSEDPEEIGFDEGATSTPPRSPEHVPRLQSRRSRVSVDRATSSKSASVRPRSPPQRPRDRLGERDFRDSQKAAGRGSKRASRASSDTKTISETKPPVSIPPKAKLLVGIDYGTTYSGTLVIMERDSN